MSTTNDNASGDCEEITSNKEECISCEHNNVDNITEGINSLAVRDDVSAVLDDTSICANCGKEGNSDDMNTCNKCKEVKYCNAACKKKHRKKHKKACERRVAEIYDEKLFIEVEPDECPICLQPMPHDATLTIIEACCGKRICLGCVVAMKMSEEGINLCPFCRTRMAGSPKEEIQRINKLVDKGNGEGFHLLAGKYAQGKTGLPQDDQEANELNLKAGELGCAGGYLMLGLAYKNGWGVERDDKRMKHYFELAAMGGSVKARHNLGCIEGSAGNHYRAMKHFVMAARAGHKESLELVKEGIIDGLVTKDEYAATLRLYQKMQDEMKSEARDQAAKFRSSTRIRM